MAASRCRDSRSAKTPRNCPPSKIGMEIDGPTANAVDVGENRLVRRKLSTLTAPFNVTSG
jgi:hypothetical protein